MAIAAGDAASALTKVVSVEFRTANVSVESGETCDGV